MTSQHASNNEDGVTFIAPGTMIKGEMTFAGPVRISGRVEGVIHAEDLLEITAEGHVEGDIHGTFLDIQGSVKGNITALKSCRLHASARITGELHSANLSIAEGASFIGKVCVGGQEAAKDEDPAMPVRQPEAVVMPAVMPVQVAVAQPVMAHTVMAQHAAPAARVETPVSVLQSRLEQMAVEAEQVAVAAQMGQQPLHEAIAEPMVRVNNQAVQATLNRSPRIIKATR